MKGVDPLRFVGDHHELIGHIHVADHPGRHEPGTGTIHFSAIFERLDDLGYPGLVGCEYKPRGSSGESLGWLRRLRV